MENPILTCIMSKKDGNNVGDIDLEVGNFILDVA
uniref:Uncharacterized protein n=1 Tax=Vitis vinifera TaxID=29760 RepID=F6HN12_VITVI